MPETPAQIAVLDACVLYPATLRNFMLRLAEEDAFRPRWSADIVQEFVGNILKDRPSVTPDNLSRTVALMNGSFPEALVTGYAAAITTLTLPDPNDRHVLAAALKAKASTIVTLNLKDFPAAELAKHGIVAVHPDAFVLGLMETDATKVELAFSDQQKSLKNPPVAVAELLAILEKQGLVDTVRQLRTRLTGT